jgi:hypothetical protein
MEWECLYFILKNKLKKYETKNQWRLNSGGAFQAAIKNNWIEECIAHMKKRNKIINIYNDEKF